MHQHSTVANSIANSTYHGTATVSKIVTVPVDLLQAVVQVVDPVLSALTDTAGARVELQVKCTDRCSARGSTTSSDQYCPCTWQGLSRTRYGQSLNLDELPLVKYLI